MMGPGRPLRFMVGLIGLWVGARVVLLWPVGDAIAAEAAIAPAPVQTATAVIAASVQRAARPRPARLASDDAGQRQIASAVLPVQADVLPSPRSEALVPSMGDPIRVAHHHLATGPAPELAATVPPPIASGSNIDLHRRSASQQVRQTPSPSHFSPPPI